MTYTSIFEKLLCLFNIVSTSWVYIGFGLITILLIILLAVKKISKKTCFILVVIATKLVLGYTIYIYYEDVTNLVNYIVDNIFLNIYFPSAYVYLLVLILVNVAAISTLLNFRVEKIYKTINGVCLIITNFILALVIEIIAKNDIDIFAKESLFTNTSLVTLLELSINVFIAWLISLIAAAVINTITERIIIARENRKLVNNPANTIVPEIEVNIPTIKEEYNSVTTNMPLENPVQAFIPDTNFRFIPNFKIEVNEIEPIKEIVPTIKVEPILEPAPVPKFCNDNTFDLSAFIPKKQEVKPISILSEQTNNNNIFEQILNNELPVIKEETKVIEPVVIPVVETIKTSCVDEIKNTYTLNDYRIFNKMLKDIREHNESNSIVIDKNLEYRLITKYSSETYDMFKTMLKIYSN